MVYEHTKLTQHALKIACEPARERRIAQYKSDKGSEEEDKSDKGPEEEDTRP